MARRSGTERPIHPVLSVEMSNMGTIHGYAVEVHRVVALMLFPRDSSIRANFVMSAAYDHLSRFAEIMSPPGVVTITAKSRNLEIRPVRRFAIEALAPKLHWKGMKGIADDGRLSGPAIAAAILQYSLSMACAGHPELGIMRIIAELGEALKSEGVVGAGRDRLTEVWAEYRPVAHIAAARASLENLSLRDRRVFFEWLGRASDLLKEAEALGSRFAEPILPPEECWHIVLIPSVLGRGVPENLRDSVLVTSRVIGSS